MKILIVEDDLSSRRFLYKFMSDYGDCDITVDGIEALDAYMLALDDKEPYDLICIDIMMPKVDGIKVLKTIRRIEEQKGIEEDKKATIIMTTALNEFDLVQNAYDSGCEAYATKPLDVKKLRSVMEKLNFSKKEIVKE